MKQQDARMLLEAVAAGTCSPEAALQALRTGPFQEMLSHVNGLRLDGHRDLRTGQGEVIFAPGKPVPALLEAMSRLSGEASTPRPALATRVSPEQGAALADRFPEGDWWPEARLFACHAPLPLRPGLEEPAPGAESAADLAADLAAELAIVTAGTSDMPVALEALGAARFHGLEPALVADAGVAGLHRLTPHLHTLLAARLLIVVAGMEGALPSVLGGLMGTPILAVPTSVGYGASFGGLAALLAMLNSCAPGVAVCNIDNGFGAAMLAVKLLRPRP